MFLSFIFYLPWFWKTTNLHHLPVERSTPSWDRKNFLYLVRNPKYKHHHKLLPQWCPVHAIMIIGVVNVPIMIMIIIIIIIDNIVILSWNTWGQQRSAMHFSFLDLGRLLFPGNCWSGIWRNSSCHIPSISRPYGIMKLKVRAIVLVVVAVFFFKYSSSQISRLFTRVQFQKQNFDAQPGTWPRSCWQYPLVLVGFDQQLSLAVFF